MSTERNLTGPVALRDPLDAMLPMPPLPGQVAQRLRQARCQAASLAVTLADLERDLLSSLRVPESPAAYRELRRHVAQAHDEAAGLREGLYSLETRAEGVKS